MAKPRKFPVAFQNFFIYKKIVSTCVLNSRERNLSLVIDPSLANERNHAMWYYDGHENKLILLPLHGSAVTSYYLQMIWWIMIRVYACSLCWVPPYLNQLQNFVKLYIQSQGLACAYQVALLIPLWHLYELGMNRMKYFSQKNGAAQSSSRCPDKLSLWHFERRLLQI